MPSKRAAQHSLLCAGLLVMYGWSSVAEEKALL
jgi:hypothetical protein